MRRIGVLLLTAAAGVAAGLAAERGAFGWDDPRHWVPDLTVGWASIGCGLAASALRPGSRCGVLMVITGFTWFLGNFSTVDLAAVSWSAGNALYLYRGVLVHLVLTYPTGRTDSWPVRVTITLGYVVSVFRPVWQ